MTKYEMLYILDNALSDEAKDGIVKKIEDLVVEHGGVIEKTDRWGARKLQYPINYKSEGYYVLTTFEAEKSLVVGIKRIVGITDGIIRRLITKI
jgi:small subunit ribosomal protein S6